MITKIRKRQSSAFDHIMRREILKRDNWKDLQEDDLLSWHGGESAHQLTHASGDCGLWRGMISYTSRQGT